MSSILLLRALLESGSWWAKSNLQNLLRTKYGPFYGPLGPTHDPIGAEIVAEIVSSSATANSGIEVVDVTLKHINLDAGLFQLLSDWVDPPLPWPVPHLRPNRGLLGFYSEAWTSVPAKVWKPGDVVSLELQPSKVTQGILSTPPTAGRVMVRTMQGPVEVEVEVDLAIYSTKLIGMTSFGSQGHISWCYPK